MEINVFRYPKAGSRLMIYNLDTAREFMKQCKRGITVWIAEDSYLEISSTLVTLYKVIDEWTSFEVHSWIRVEAYRTLFKYRKYVNALFAD